jgi:hypothetical protein
MSSRLTSDGVKWEVNPSEAQYHRFMVNGSLQGLLGHYSGPNAPIGYWLWTMQWGYPMHFGGELTVNEARDTAQAIWRLGP